MEAKPAFLPTCVLQVNINCCKACPMKLNKKLQKSFGVSSVYIDKEKDLVIVCGNIDPANIIEAIKKIGKKKAVILSYRKEPPLEKLNHHEEDDFGKENPTKLVDQVKKIGKTKILSSEKLSNSAHEDNSNKANPIKLVEPVKKIEKKKVAFHEDNSGKVNPTKLVEPVKQFGKKKAEILFVGRKKTHEDDSCKKNTTKLVEPIKDIGKMKAKSAEILSDDKEKVPNHQFNKTHSAHWYDSDSSLDDDDDHVVHDESCEFAHHRDHHNIHKMKSRHHDHVHKPHRHSQLHPQPYNVHGNGENINGGRLFGKPPTAAASGGCRHISTGSPPVRPPHGYQGYHHQTPPPPPPLPPPPPGYYDCGYEPYYKEPDPLVGNSVYHSLSDDNTKTCIVM